jgi:predicted SnoaL-like aldol condensation-catalyzing enzyme
MNIRGTLLCCSGAAAFLLLAGSAFAQMDANAKFCDEFDQTVIIGGKIDQASKYLTDDFKEHNARLTANGLAEFSEKMKGFRAAMAGRGGGGGGRGRGAAGGPEPVRTVLSKDDLVVFITNTPERDDPNNPGKKLPATSHFDVYKLRGGKIAEHWD